MAAEAVLGQAWNGDLEEVQLEVGEDEGPAMLSVVA